MDSLAQDSAHPTARKVLVEPPVTAEAFQPDSPKRADPPVTIEPTLYSLRS